MQSPLKTVMALASVACAVSVLPARQAWAAPYSVMLESNVDRTNNEIYLANYDSYAGLLNNVLAGSSAYSSLNVTIGFNVGGFTYEDGGSYSVLLESVIDQVDKEIYIASYASWSDLLSNSLNAMSAFSDLNVSPGFSVGGLSANVKSFGSGNDFPGDDPGDGGGPGGNPGNDPGDGGGPGGTPVPEPSTLSLVGLAAAGLAFSVRRRRTFRPCR